MNTYLTPGFQDSKIEERKVRKTKINPDKDLLLARAILENEEELLKKNLDGQQKYSAGEKYKKIRNKPNSSTPGTNVGKTPESSTDKRILGKKNMHISINEQIVSKKSSNKSFVYRMNSSFSKESPVKKQRATKEANLPSINNKTSDASQPDGLVENKAGKPSKAENGSRITKSRDGRKRQRDKSALNNSKTQYNIELQKLKQAGDLRWTPKLCVDIPMSIERIKFSQSAYENDNKWNYRIMGKEDYQRREQIKKLESTSQTQVVYDSLDKSPFYTDSNPYIDDKKLLEAKKNSGFVNPNINPRGYRRQKGITGIPNKDRIYTSLNPYYILENEDDTTLVFESRFESGNLKRAVKIEDYEYDLILRNDYNSQGYTQWFYFRVTNTRSDKKYLFNIYHFYKPESIYNEGMRPLIYSKKKEAKEGVGWMRIGEDICYYQNTTKRKSGSGFLYSLSFSFDLPFNDDEVYFCHHYPYTYRDCKEFLDNL
eukprot:CAMPEP_0196994994 /NCGR_PEP_ID=MMETSP1380-20130617/1196_1 /TAXON_ID=5936 /ORGANISM="Euplotes crassus, Strain CT5" /LENGTH=484 /DNA_ID=CAMNT_0042410527 /DNA_START=360 /DNA_END=1815 /DNA_ORIENTATION=-